MLTLQKDMFDYVPAALNPNVTSYLVYDSEAALPAAADLSSFDAIFDDTTLVPTDGEAALGDPDTVITLDFDFDVLGNGAN